MRLRATVYYRETIHATDEGAVLRYDIPGGYHVTQVSPPELHLAEIEASALLSYAQMDMDCEVPLSYYGGRWYARPDAPWGLGNKSNPLVPGRDYAHGHRHPWPYGTRLRISDIPPPLRGRIRHVMYRADLFGPHDGHEPPQDRVDLYVGTEIRYRDSVHAEVDYPWPGVDTDPVRGCQQALVALGYALPQYGTDGYWGDETAGALRRWLGDDSRRFAWGCPSHVHARDPEIYWTVRRAAEEHMS
jgi:hypothetical protein